MRQSMQLGVLVGVMVVLGCQSSLTSPQAAPGHDHGAPGAGPESRPPDAGARTEPKPSMAGSYEVAIRNFVYEPASLSIRVGESVRWTNYDAAPHDAVAYTGSWKTPLLKVKESASQVYREPGVYPYYCTVHPAMRGTVEVRE